MAAKARGVDGDYQRPAGQPSLLHTPFQARGSQSGAVQLLQAMLAGSSGVGLIPEQVWELPALAPSPFGTDPIVASIGFQPGHPAGSAAPLTWASGVYARLLNDVVANKLLDR